MLNGNNTIQDLLDKQNALESERPAIDAEFERITALKVDLDERIKALSLVVKMFTNDNEVETYTLNEVKLETVSTVTAETDGTQDDEFELVSPDGVAESSKPLKKLVPDNFSKLPQVFTKHDVSKLILSLRPDMDEVNDNTLSGIMRKLVKLDFSRIKVAGSGKAPQVYEKLIV
jgi:hypothetical protein